MRTAFIKQLVEEAKRDERVFLIVGDLGYNVVNDFERQFPERFLNAGIAEQNMIGVAAGMAKEGYIVYCYSIGNFPTLRCIEQIRNDVAYHNLNVRIVSVGAGFAYGGLGASHHATEDIAMMRTIPNMAVASPCDPKEAQEIVRLSIKHQGPMYLRLGKAGEKVIHDTNSLSFNFGEILPVIEHTGKDQAIFVTGSVAASIKEDIEKNQVKADLYSFPFVKPIDLSKLRELAQLYNKIIVVEEHQLNGGFSSAIMELIGDMYSKQEIENMPKVIRKGIPDMFMHVSGSQAYLRGLCGIGI